MQDFEVDPLNMHNTLTKSASPASSPNLQSYHL